MIAMECKGRVIALLASLLLNNERKGDNDRANRFNDQQLKIEICRKLKNNPELAHKN
jgi:hypothetical protein